jgi:AcrR family transcriptional regulator
MSQADLTHQRLVRAAVELFTTLGYHETTTPQLAKKAGVAEGTIYRHFASKRDIWNEVYRAAVRWAAERVAEAAGQTGEPRARLDALGRNLAAGAGREPAVTRLCFLTRHGALLDDGSRRAARDFQSALEGLVAEAKAAGVVKRGTAELWAAVWLSVVSVALERIVTREWTPDHAGVAQTLEAAWDAIAAAPPAAATEGGAGHPDRDGPA